jgi:hypothetical protein
MAAITLIHGIDNDQLTPDGVEAEWLPALAGGVRLTPPPSWHSTQRHKGASQMFRPNPGLQQTAGARR